MRLSLVVAMDRNRLIGRGGGLPWRLPADLKRFKSITMGKPIIMGRRTHESIGRALPGRRNIVLTRNEQFAAEGCEVFHSLPEVLAALHDVLEVMVVGGAALYVEALPLCARLYLTEVDTDTTGDVYFPEFQCSAWHEVSSEQHVADAEHAYDYCFRVLDRIS
ncbi:MAG: dihydrofolate reductase [Proteobacteria bacterium]|nr:dihydrofolate reductase [Pseudomonadota bacterium]